MEALKEFLDEWLDISKRDRSKLAEQYSAAFPGKSLGDCPKCEAKAITDLRRYLFNLEKESDKPGESGEDGRDYILLPGDHQFVAGDKIHNNGNITDEIAEFYVKNYPHTKTLFAKLP